MSIHLDHLLVSTTSVDQFISQDYAIYEQGTLLVIKDIETYKRITIFFYPLGKGVQGFIQSEEDEPFDPFYLTEPLHQTIRFQSEHYECTLRYYPFEYCSNKGEYPVELVVYIPDMDKNYCLEISFDGKVRLFHQ